MWIFGCLHLESTWFTSDSLLHLYRPFFPSICKVLTNNVGEGCYDYFTVVRKKIVWFSASVELMKELHLCIYFIGKFTYIERRHISHLEYLNVVYNVSLYDVIILLCKSNSYAISGIILTSDMSRTDAKPVFNVSVCLH